MAPADDARDGALPAFPLLPPGLGDAVMARLYPPPHPYADDPVGWMRDVAHEVTWSMQDTIAESVRDHRYTAVKACHGAGKSFIASRLMAWWADVNGHASYIVWTAPRGDQVHAIIGEELRDLERAGKLRGSVDLGGKWMLDGKRIGQGRKPADHDAHGFQGIHRDKVLVIIDEACGIPEALWTAVDAILTGQDARCLAIGNPDDPTAHFADVCKPGSGWNVLTIDALLTPQFTDEGRRLPPDVVRRLTSKTWVEERRVQWGEDSPQWTSKVRGEFPLSDERSAFPPGYVLRAVNCELPGTERGTGGFDIARLGPDHTVGYRNRGGHVRRVLRCAKLDNVEVADRIGEYLDGVPALPAVIDADGVGSGVYDILSHRGYNVIPFHGATKARNPKRFGNRRAEAYWAVRELMEAGLLDIDPRDDDLLGQMSKIRFHEDAARRIWIESKEDMVKRLGRKARKAGKDPGSGSSPDELDAFVYACVEVADVSREALDAMREDRERAERDRRARASTVSDAPSRGGTIVGDIREVPL